MRAATHHFIRCERIKGNQLYFYYFVRLSYCKAAALSCHEVLKRAEWLRVSNLQMKYWYRRLEIIAKGEFDRISLLGSCSFIEGRPPRVLHGS